MKTTVNNSQHFFNSKVTKVENGSTIKRLARDVVRMANADHPMLKDTYTKFVEAGENAPSYALLSLKHAEYDAYAQAAKDYNSDLITREEYLTKFSNTRSKLSELERSETGLKLSRSLKNLWIKNNPFDMNNTQDKDYIKAYIETAKKAKKYALKKIAILTALTETSNTLMPCHANKRLKKITYRVLRLINR